MVHQFAMTNQMITTKNHGNLPIYQQITEQISREISAGLLIDGERLPTERDMAKRYGVAVRTLRKSLAQLTQMGLLIRRQGSGNYIRKNENHDSIYSFFRLELPSGGGLPSAQIISMDTIAKPADLPAFGEADFGHRFRRLRFLDDVPAALEEIWLDGSVVAKINPALVSQSLYKFYRDQLGLWIARAEDWVSLDTVPDWGIPPFSLPTGTMAGYVERFGWSQADIKVEYSRNWFNPKTVRYVARLK
jgi:GntR family transcriptional regulator